MGQQNSNLTVIVVHLNMHLIYHNHPQITIMIAHVHLVYYVHDQVALLYTSIKNNYIKLKGK